MNKDLILKELELREREIALREKELKLRMLEEEQGIGSFNNDQSYLDEFYDPAYYYLPNNIFNPFNNLDLDNYSIPLFDSDNYL